MFASLLTALQAIPELVGLLKQLVGAVQTMIDSYQKAQTEKWINAGKELAHQIALAKSDEERAELVKKLSNQWNNIP